MEIGIGIGISTVLIVLIGLFIVYRIGLIRLAQVATDKSIVVAEAKLGLWEISSAEGISRKFGKIATKLDDDKISRSSYNSTLEKLSKL